MKCTSVCTTHINGIHKQTHRHCTLYIYRYMYRYSMLLYLCLHNFTLFYDLTIPKRTLLVHTLCSDQLYCCTFILSSSFFTLWDSTTVYTTALYNCTLASASLASVLSTNHRRASIYLLLSDCPAEWSV
jgi:hypothetical protein